MWEPRCLTTLWASTACYSDRFFTLHSLCNVAANELNNLEGEPLEILCTQFSCTDTQSSVLFTWTSCFKGLMNGTDMFAMQQETQIHTDWLDRIHTSSTNSPFTAIFNTTFPTMCVVRSVYLIILDLMTPDHISGRTKNTITPLMWL
jgi:hypothetical protein